MGLFSSLFGGGNEKEARRGEDIARQREEVLTIGNQFLSQLVPGSEEYNQFQAFIQLMASRVAEGAFAVPELGGISVDQQEAVRQFGQQLVSQQQGRIARGEPATALEARTQAAFGGLREVAAPVPFEQDILDILGGQGIDTPLGQVFQGFLERAQDPNRFFESSFAPELELATQNVRNLAARRGLIGSGLELEDLGRAGVDLAIKTAQERESFRQQQLQNLGSVVDLANTLRGRQIGLEDALVNLQSGRESRLTDLLTRETGTRIDDLVKMLADRTSFAAGERLSAEEEAAATRQQLGQLIGQGAGALIDSFGGPAGAVAGAQIGSMATGGRGSGADILASQRSTPITPSPRELSAGLSRTPRPIGQLTGEELDDLLRKLVIR